MPLSEGTTFAGYRIVRLLGSGGMGDSTNPPAATTRPPAPESMFTEAGVDAVGGRIAAWERWMLDHIVNILNTVRANALPADKAV